jgi:hypothetical protein
MKWRVFLFLLMGTVAVKTTAQPAPFHPVGFHGLYRPASITLLPDEAAETTQLQAGEGKADAETRLAFRYLAGAGVPMDAAKAVEWFRKAADQGDANAQVSLGFCYMTGTGIGQDEAKGVGWFVKAARQNNLTAEFDLAWCHEQGVVFPQSHQEAFFLFEEAARQGDAAAQYAVGYDWMEGIGAPVKNEMEGAKWYRRAAEQGYDAAQLNLGNCYQEGKGVSMDLSEAVKWFHRSAMQGDPAGQFNLAMYYQNGAAVAKDYVLAYQWFNLAAAQGLAEAKAHVADLEQHMTPEQIADGQRLATMFVPQLEMPLPSSTSATKLGNNGELQGMASGFFITPDGYFITAEHVVRGAGRIELVTSTGQVSAVVVKIDPVDDLALLKAEGRFAALPVASSRPMRMGATVATIGFPDVALQGFAPKLAKGEIAAISGFRDDPRYFQISVPVQPGNSGGALVGDRGNVVGVVCAKLNAIAAILATGAVPENVNYAVKSTFLLGFLESAPEVTARLKKENTRTRKLDDVIQSAQEAAVMVKVYGAVK